MQRRSTRTGESTRTWGSLAGAGGILTVLALTTLALTTSWAADSPDTPAWNEVKQAMNRGLPKTAIEKLEPIIDAAKSDRRFAEAIRATALKISLEGNIQGNQPEEKISRLKAAIAASPEQMKPVLRSILANWTWQYFQQNRWRFAQRTDIDGPPGNDLTTYSLPQILDEVADQFGLALDAADELKRTPVGDYDDLLTSGVAPDIYRPTMYDFVVYDALEFFAAGEQAGSTAIDAFTLRDSSPIFDPVAEFLAFAPEGDSPTATAVRLHQDLLRFHAGDEDPAARLDADLARLRFGSNRAVGPDKDDRYRAALRRFIEDHLDHPISARAAAALATSLRQDDRPAEARQVAAAAVARHPDTAGGKECQNLISAIEAKSLAVASERVWNEPLPSIDVTYRNVDKLYFRLVRYEFDEFLRSDRWRPTDLDNERRMAILNQTPVRSWSVDLPKTDDFKNRTESFTAPAGVPPGSYFLIASGKPSFSPADNDVSFSEVWQSDLAMVVRDRPGEGIVEGFVLNAKTGRPLANVRVDVWARDRSNRWVGRPALTTDGQGRFSAGDDGNNGRGLLFMARRGNQSLVSANPISPRRFNRGQVKSEGSVFFTDRSIYRPGQTIRFNAICYRVDADDDDYGVLAGRRVRVVFRDVNRDEVAALDLRTNDYGSVQGSFTAPRDRVTGRMQIRIEEGPGGSTDVQVEQYKRPKFEVTLDPPAAAGKLNDLVTVGGIAKTYSGSNIQDAKVSYRVVRSVRYPVWCWWRYPWVPRSGQSQEIALGETQTGPDGSFEVSFVAKPDDAVDPKTEPTFEYQVTADVTDTTGETRSSTRTIRVGYAALSASLTADDWQTVDDSVDIVVRTESLDGEGQTASGTVKVYSLQQPNNVIRPRLNSGYPRLDGETQITSDPNTWSTGEVVAETDFSTDVSGTAKLTFDLNAGIYRAMLETTDRFGKSVSAVLPIHVLDPDAKRLATKIPWLLIAPESSVQPGDTYKLLWGSGYESARVFVEIEHRDETLRSYWTDDDSTQGLIEVPIEESMRGGVIVRTTMVRENRAYLKSTMINVPWTNKQLTVSFEKFTSRLKPGAEETWTAIIRGPDAEAAAAELVGTLYDASLDAFKPHRWMRQFNVFRRQYDPVRPMFVNEATRLRDIGQGFRTPSVNWSWGYRKYPDEIIRTPWGFGFGRGRMMMRGGGGAVPAPQAMAAPMPADAMIEDAPVAEAETESVSAFEESPGQKSEISPPQVDLDSVSARTNLNETAFFFPTLTSGEDGSVRMSFTMPEALTRWQFYGFAHDTELRSGFLSATAETFKDLMVEPNPPRFLREGDRIELTVKVTNRSVTRQRGTARLSLTDARTNDPVDAKLGNHEREQTFDLAAGDSVTLAWPIEVADGTRTLVYRAVGASDRASDGEEGFLPVLPRKVLVTESIQLPIRGAGTKTIDFEKLLAAGDSDSLDHRSLTIQMASNPSWYAVMALPYLMEYPHQCAEQTFNRLYANSLAAHIAGSDPKINRVFEQWRNTDAPDSPLEKNEDLKSVLIEETPWVRDADSESAARRNVGILFDTNRLRDETGRAASQLAQMQLSDGSWPWFPGGRANDYITLYITTGFGRLRHLGVDVDVAPALKSLNGLDAWMTERYAKIKSRDQNHLSTSVALYLYGRSFFIDEQPIAPEHQTAFQYWRKQAAKHWLDLPYRQSQAHLAIAAHRLGDRATARAIVDSIRERSVSDDEMGMFWRELEASWWWYRAPIETQAMMIELFDEVAGDAEAVEDCKVWLLKQKQTQNWNTTKGTADAIYALLLRGTGQLASDQLVRVAIGGREIEPESVQAGTGFYSQRIAGPAVEPAMGEITVTKVDSGVAWGGAHWQYLEDISKITAHDGTPLFLQKALFVKTNTPQGPKLIAVDGPVEVGDELVVRIVLRSDRDMEYLHLKDHRGSGTEPVNVISRYRFQDGLAYYESTTDTASHFFIDYLPKGTYVFEYSSRVQLRGEYQTGMANIQCLYAPEFSSHSESLSIEAR